MISSTETNLGVMKTEDNDTEIIEVRAKRSRKRSRSYDTTTDSVVVDKLEKSRQSARECRVRKKMRYQYLEELVQQRENAILKLRAELEIYKKYCIEIDSGVISKEVKQAVMRNELHNDTPNQSSSSDNLQHVSTSTHQQETDEKAYEEKHAT